MRTSNSATSPARTRATISASEGGLSRPDRGVACTGGIRSLDVAGAAEVTGVTFSCSAASDSLKGTSSMNEVTMNGRQSLAAYWALRIALGVVPIVAGLDKFTNLLANWPGYLSPLAARLLPISPEAFMRVAGIVEIAVGALILL